MSYIRCRLYGRIDGWLCLWPSWMDFRQRWANNSVFEYIRIVRTEYIRKPNYSVLFKNRIIFVFLFGRYFQTEYIRIRIRLSFFDRIYSYSYSVYDNIRIIFAFQLTWKYNLTASKPIYKEASKPVSGRGGVGAQNFCGFPMDTFSYSSTS